MLFLFATFLLLVTVVEGNTMYVTPNVTTNTCPGTPCFELNSYAHNSSYYFFSDAIFIFLPGIHVLDSFVMVANKDNITMIGSSNLTQYNISVKVLEYRFDPYDKDSSVTYQESSTKVFCTGYNNTGLVFSNISNLILINITFESCGMYSNLTDKIAGIQTINTYNLVMEGVSIQSSTGYGFLGINLFGHTKVTRSSFIANNQNVKETLIRGKANDFECNAKLYTNNTIYYGNSDPTLAGGNIVIQYKDHVSYDGVSHIDFSTLVVSLGIDGSFCDPTQSCSLDENYLGTGLSLILSHNMYYVNITIQNSTFYRNQASFGANIYMYLSAQFASFNITLCNVSSIQAVSIRGGVLVNYYTQKQVHFFFKMQHMNFECNYAVMDGSSFAIETIGTDLRTNQLIMIENCHFKSDYIERGTKIYARAAMDFLIGSNLINVHIIDCVITDMVQTKVALNAVSESTGQFEICGCIFADSKVSLESFIKLSISNSEFYNSQISAINVMAITLNGNVTFSRSVHIQNGGAIFLLVANIEFSPQSYVTFFNNSAMYGGAIFLLVATIEFSPQSYVTFFNNSAMYGGAIYMADQSYLNYSSPTNVTFKNNSALVSGGAIYIVSTISSQLYEMPCFFQYTYGHPVGGIYVYFDSNFAGEAGSALYGGNIDLCTLHSCKDCSSGKAFNRAHHFGYHDNTSSLISSNPQSICICNKLDERECNTSTVSRTVYPGERITLSFVTIGQRDGISPGTVMMYNHTAIPFTSAFISSKRCTDFDIPYSARNGSLYLSTEVSYNVGKSIYGINVSISVLPCPAGFRMDHSSSSCTCDPILIQYVQVCNISNQTLTKSRSTWIGYNSQGNLSLIDPCPSDYCRNMNNISVFQFDSQCNYNRMGVACGQCPSNFSMTFGTSQCKPCTNYNLMLVVPFALMGIALILFLTLFNLTVSSGTINGIILYAFVIRLYDHIFFPPSDGAYGKVLDFLSVFIAWLNLDFGIEACFYNGMTSQAKMWLQFSFLFYMIVLVATIILASRYSSSISRICRYNMVPVISTLLVLFYAKLLRIVATIFTYTNLLQSVNASTTVLSHVYVWYYDSAVPYFGYQHGLLFTAASVATAVFILPYTAVMLLTPCLISKSHWKVMCWMNRLKPVIDCYEAPFKDRYRFWTGATLFYRIVFCIMFSLFTNKQPTIVLLVIVVIHAFMIVMVGLAIYKHWLVSMMEGFFHINIVIHSLTLFFLYFFNEPVTAIPSIVCVGSAFIFFLCTLLFQTLNRLWGKKCFPHMVNTRLVHSVQAKSRNMSNVENVYVYREPVMDED